MISEKMKNIMKSGSAIRAMFEEGKRLADIYGKENVYDFSLGNPSVPAPQTVNSAIKEIVDSVDPLTLHGYMSNSGYVSTRKAVADNLNKRYGANFIADNIVMTVGAAGGLNVALKAIVNAGEEVVVIAPYFGEYNNYIANVDGKITVVPPNPPTFQPDMGAFEKAINSNTRAVIINTPNNPTGVIYDENTLRKMSEILTKKSKEYSSVIYLISDEPYRELAYDNEKVPFIPDFYANTIIGYSYSKSLSLPGERIGYLAIPSEADGFEELVSACNVATRILGFVNAPSLQQLAVERCIDEKTDVSAYDKNRQLLYSSLSEYGFECVRPQGAFYMFVKSPIEESEFVAKAKSYNILLVGGKSFACEGYVRIAYCVSYDMIKASLPSFKKLAEEIFGK